MLFRSNAEWYKRINRENQRIEGSDIVTGSGLLYHSAQTQIRSQILDHFDCKSVLDVGMGRGDNIIALAAFNPRLEKLIGIEPTENGYQRSLEWDKDIKNSDMELVGLGESLKDIDFKKIQFIHGSGLDIPLPDKSVDEIGRAHV